MAMTFPSTPTVGQQYSVSGGPTYTWDGTVWKILTPGSQFSEQQFTATAGQTVFTVTGGYVIGGIDVYRNGVKLIVGVDYLATDLSTVTLTNACSAGDTVEVVSLAQILYSDALRKSNNLSDVTNAATALANLGGLPKAGGTMTATLTQIADASGTVQMFRGRSSDGLAQIGIRNNADTAWVGLLQFTADGTLIWNSGSALAPKFSIDPNGLLTLNQGQIKFPATQVASSDAHTLDWYEEGTFNVSMNPDSGSITMASKTLSYRRVGSIVHISGLLGISSVTTPGGQLSISGLPFPAVVAMPYWSGVCPNDNLSTKNRLYIPATGGTYLQYSLYNDGAIASSITSSWNCVVDITYVTT